MLHLGRIGLFLFLIVLGFNACELDSVPGTITVTEVEDEFYVDLWESLSPDSRNFILKIRTIDNQECTNTTIDASLSIFNSTLRFFIDDIDKPNDCISGFQPATKDLEVGEISGTKIVQINLRNTVENNGRLVIEEDRYLLDMETENGFLLLHDELLKVPKATIWGYITYQKEEDETIAENFMVDLEDVSTVASFKGGYYGHFTITNSSNLENAISVADQPSTSQIKTFIYNQGDKQSLINLLATYRANFGNQIAIKLFTANGEEL